MNRPTSALHLTGATLSLRLLGAEPHAKEVGYDEGYDRHRVRSALRNGGQVILSKVDLRAEVEQTSFEHLLRWLPHREVVVLEQDRVGIEHVVDVQADVRARVAEAQDLTDSQV